MVASGIYSSLILNGAELGIRHGAINMLTKRPLTIWQAVLNYFSYLRPFKNKSQKRQCSVGNAKPKKFDAEVKTS